jgi:chromosome segregation ATPase
MNLTPEQIELLLRLIGAIIIGFIFGYMLARSFAKEKYEPEIEELEQILDDKDDEIEKSSAKYGQLKQHLAVQASELKSVNMQIVDAQDSIKTHESKLALLSDEKEHLETLLKQKDVLLQQNDEEINSLNKEIEFLKNELIGVQKLAEEYKSANKDQKEKVLAIKSEMEKNTVSTQERNMLVEKVDRLSKSNREKEAIIEELKKRSLSFSTLQQEKEQLESKINKLLKEQLHIKQELDQKTADIINLEKKSIDLERELEQKKEVKVTSSVDNTSKQELEKLREKLKLKEKSLEIIEDKLQQSESKIKRLQNSSAPTYMSTSTSKRVDKKGWNFSNLSIVKFAKDAKDRLGHKINKSSNTH